MFTQRLDEAKHRAATRAIQSPGECFSVYHNGIDVWVRTSNAAAPANAQLECIAQQWDAHTVQLRYTGARSEWVRYD